MLSKNDLLQYFYCDENIIFHYTRFNTALKIISSNKLLMSPLSNTNDPLEFNDYSDCTLYDGSLSIQEMMGKEREIEIAKQRRKNIVRQLSFSHSFKLDEKDPQQNIHNNYMNQGWARNRMWAQYADKHAGVCLVFDKDKCTKAAEKIPDSKVVSKNIVYTNNLYKLQDAMHIDIQQKYLATDFSDFFITDDKIDLYFIKCEDYAAENEFRILSFNYSFKRESDKCLFDFEDSLLGVILGTKIDDPEIEIIKKILNGSNIPFFKMKWHCGEPDLYTIKGD